jgi:hypothetical protein
VGDLVAALLWLNFSRAGRTPARLGPRTLCQGPRGRGAARSGRRRTVDPSSANPARRKSRRLRQRAPMTPELQRRARRADPPPEHAPRCVDRVDERAKTDLVARA